MAETRRNFLAGAVATSAAIIAKPILSEVAGDKPAVRPARSSAPETRPQAGAGPARLNVRDAAFGAVADGSTKDTAAFQAALDRCAVLGGGEVLVPPGNYLIGSVQIRSNTVLRLSEGTTLHGSPDKNDYPVSTVRWEGRWIPGHVALLYGIDATNLGIVGPGKILGAESLGGRPNVADPLRHPSLVEFIRCGSVVLRGFSTHYARMWNVHPTNCHDVWCEGLTLRSETGNGDGIDVDSCRNVWIERCDIATGDDCISLKSGRGSEGFTLAQITENVTITDCTFSDNIFACIGIGSETSGGIRNVRIQRCKFTGAKTFAIYIKSRPGRGAAIENIVCEDLDIAPIAPNTFGGGFLRFNLLNSGLLGEDPVPGLEGIPQGRNFVFRNIRVQGVPILVDGSGVPVEKPIDGLTLENITGSAGKGIQLANARNVVIKNVDVTVSEGPLLAIKNVQGKGLTGAAELTTLPKVPEPVPPRPQPYKLQ